jgi:amino acid adenylation domain-containing protein
VLKGSGHDGAQSVRSIERLPARPTYPSAVNQQSLWLLAQTVPDLSAYNMQFSLRLEGMLDFDSLAKSVGAILKRHESLRTIFKVEDDRPVLEILEFNEPAIEFVDLREMEDGVREKEAERLAAEECARPFRLASGSLYRFKLFRLADDRHRLYVTVHHLIFDGRSIGVFAREFVKHYRAQHAGKSLPSPTGGVQYQDCVAWRERRLSGEIDERLSPFWKQSLEGSSLVLDFPVDYTRPTVQTFNGAYQKASLPADLKETLAEFNRREQSTPFMTLLAVFYALLYRYSNQEDILVGCPVADRNHPELENLIGYFANINVLRAKLSKGQTFRELLAAVRENCLRSFEHQSLPFAKLVELMRPGKSLSHTPIFQVTFAYHDKLFKGQVDEQLRLDTYEDGNSAAKFDFALDVQDLDEGLELRLTYNTDLFAEETARRFLRQYTRLLAGVVADPEKRVARYELVPEAELQRMIVEWNATAFDNPRTRCLHRLFEEQAARSPDHTALIFDAERLTYDDLNRRANRLARHLIARGVRPGAAVGVHMKRSADMIVALLAILKAGGAYLPLDPYYPRERIAYVIQDSGVPVIVTQRELESQIPACRATLISPDAERQEIGEHSSENLEDAGVGPLALMYLMYTSGSTGNPKGVMVPHGGPSNYVLWMRRRFALTADDKVLAKTSINFDISVWEIFLPLIAGAQLVVGRDEDLQAPDSLAALIRRERVTQVQFVPSALKAFVDSGWLPGCDSLSRIFSGGEALSVRLREEVFESFSGELHNLYGPTEASIYVCHYACRPDDPLRSVSIGRPVHNSKVYILDEQLSPVPVGMTGELYIGGEALADGYFKRPDITAAKFLPDPFSSSPGARMFKTGDVTRYLSDGRIEFLGRADRQVKVRGYRIELGEIEHSLARHPRVQHAIVIVREDKADDVRLVAYLLYRDKKGPVETELRDYLKQKLPDYMVPSTFVELDSIPLLPNNKVNMKALPRPEFRKNIGEGLERNYANECERTLAQIWEDVLETEKFGPEDNFFDVGGHSLLIVRLRSLIEQRLGVEVSNIDLFQYVTIRSLARHLASREQPVSQLAADMARRATLRNRRSRPGTI